MENNITVVTPQGVDDAAHRGSGVKNSLSHRTFSKHSALMVTGPDNTVNRTHTIPLVLLHVGVQARGSCSRVVEFQKQGRKPEGEVIQFTGVIHKRGP